MRDRTRMPLDDAPTQFGHDDAEFFARHLRSFVPPGAFDAHAHLYRRVDAPESMPRWLEDDGCRVGADQYLRATKAWMGDRCPEAGLFFPFTIKDLDAPSANQFQIEETCKRTSSRALMMIRPGEDPVRIEAAVQREGFIGFKVYHVYAARLDTLQAEIGEFLPDWAWDIANRRDLSIMLHIVRSRALADPLNQAYIREHCLRYPGARLILAHAARGFCGQHTVEGIASLRGLDNVFFDTSAICESAPVEAILREFGTSRLMFGTDFPVSELIGRCVSIGDGFLWLYGDNFSWSTSQFAQPHRIGIESLLALRQACESRHLSDADVERIFCTNARQLLGLIAPAASNRTQDLYRHAKQLIPGGTQLLSKRPEMYAPGRWPAYFRKAHGCEVIDLDGRRYVDMTTSGIGSCLLGYGDPDVTTAVQRRIALGSMSTLSAAEEVELAELLIGLHPWAEQVRYARSGGEAMAIAVRIARAATGRDKIAFCGYHGWSDWYLAANLNPDGKADCLHDHLLPGLKPAGVPQGLAGTALPFAYNNFDELVHQATRCGRELAAIVMEPTRSVDPATGFLERVRELCDRAGAALVFDEISSGWRMHLGGVHLKYGVMPDIAVFAKAISNGHPMAAIIGRRRLMDAAQTSFISSTNWTEAVGPTAAVATIRKLRQVDIAAHTSRIGGLMRDGWLALGRQFSVPVKVSGHAALLHLGFDHEQSAALGTFLTARMLDRSYLTGSGFYPSLAHTERHVAAYLAAAESIFAELSEAIQKGDVQQRLADLGCTVRHTGFARLT
jgi:glutamate-1-semialdehyde 2,1-aminomutase